VERERQILRTEALEGRAGNKAGSCWLLLATPPGFRPPPAKHEAELGSGGPGGHHPLAFPPSRWQRDRTQAQSKKGTGGEGAQVLGQRSGKGWFDWIWLGEREGSQMRWLWGEPLNPVLDHPPQDMYIHLSELA